MSAVLSQFIKNNLISYQKDHTLSLIKIIKNNICALDASDTGTGKTYTCIATIKHFDFKPIIVCPKSVINVWKNVCKKFKVNPLFIVNYETLRLGKYYQGVERINCSMIKRIKIKSNDNNDNNDNNENNQNITFKWSIEDLPKNTCFVFDEVHKCADINTQLGQLLFASKETNFPLIMLSATIADNPERFKFFFYLLNFLDPVQVQNDKIDYDKYMKTMIRWIYRDPKPMLRIHGMLYPERASRMRITDLGDLFPETQINAESYTMGKKREALIEKYYSIIKRELDKLKSGKKENILVKIIRARQKIELLKVPTFVELANDYLHNKLSVVIFVNFTQTLQVLANMLHTTCLIYGEQTDQVRQKNINNFQTNQSNILISNIKSGGVGISLHDLTGKWPRVSLISPTWSSLDLMQALGRIHRAGAKTKSLQRIIYTANTIEEKIAEKLRIKLTNLNSLNNGDLDLTNITFKTSKTKI
jgi:SNF2 family DNA or RNA helicase